MAEEEEDEFGATSEEEELHLVLFWLEPLLSGEKKQTNSRRCLRISEGKTSKNTCKK